jgi:hypothetical protein
MSITNITGINVDEIKKAALDQVREERVKKAKDLLLRQMRVVESAREALRAEEIKLADIEQQIQDGTF